MLSSVTCGTAAPGGTFSLIVMLDGDSHIRLCPKAPGAEQSPRSVRDDVSGIFFLTFWLYHHEGLSNFF